MPFERIVKGSKSSSFCIPPKLYPEPAGGDAVRFAIPYSELALHANSALKAPAIPVWLSPSPRPPRSTRAQALLSGMFRNYVFQSALGGSQTFVDFDTKTGNVDTVRLFTDSNNNVVWFEDAGSWAHSYRIEVADFARGYSIVALADKSFQESSTVIEKRLTAYIVSLACDENASGVERTIIKLADH
ncbi:hypothetical protein [Paraburkholderia aromaticivorans]|uniref:hypothetical protein n=1 Tax=Paraburkholderia aromaticivorans TaxID=2026199 RepID=UPI001455DE37|nr:hypothetical protein [Paraburkholderia aromaticivorans]